MNLKSKLDEWLNHNLITQKHRNSILEYENEISHNSYVRYALITLAILSVGVGSISLFASNWHLISINQKLILNAAIHFWVISTLIIKRRNYLVREALLLLEFALIMTSILLLSLFYKLDLDLFYEILIWVTLGTPLFILSRSYFNHYIWIGSISVAHLTGLGHFHSQLAPFEHVILTALPLIFLALSNISSLKLQLRDALKYFSYFYITLLIIIGASFSWYSTSSNYLAGLYGAISTFLLIAPTIIYLLRKKQTWHSVILILGICTYYIPLLFTHENLRNLAAPVFILTFIIAAAIAHKMRNRLLFDLCILLCGIRIFSIYFEFFGSKLYNSLGLIGAGGLALLLIWIWSKRKLFVSSKSPKIDPAD